ncbi:MAG: T9SS type A sorting domain-containing protein, partial [Bacteroidia bacterium]|nr:T9SS type A sorting domain-containing protein [Bacteroidia bacterium]
LETDKGDFINWGDCSINDTLWHHIAFTYDANGGLNNFRTYVDGLLKAQQTVIGKIITGNGLLMIGSRNVYSGTTKYQLDDIRLWNRALTQDELLANQVKKLTGQEAGLKMFLNFDDTFKDISGNGNDALPLYLGELKVSDFNPPVPGFDMYQNMSQVSLTNKTQNGTSFLWSFGNGTVSDKGNPVYTYPNPGEYTITLEAMNANSKTAAIRNASIEGLEHIEPIQAGNSGYSSIAVFGGGLTVAGTTFSIRMAGNPDIVGENLVAPAAGVLSAQFRLESAPLGKWDVVVKKGASEQILKEAFNIVPAEEADPWVSISGRGAIILNMWQTYTINFGNNGNVDAYGVPVWLAVTDDNNLEIEFIDFVMETPARAAEMGVEQEIKDLGPYFKTESVFGESMKARVYPLLIPVIPGKSSSSIHIRVKTSNSIKMKIWNNPPILGYQAGQEGSFLEGGESGSGGQISIRTPLCVFGVLAEAALDVGTAWAAPELNCVIGAAKFGFQFGLTPPWNKKFSLKNTAWNLTVIGIDCGLALSGIAGAYKSIGVLFANSWDYYENLKSCWQMGFADNTMNILINAVFSFDPNEMIGPAGYGASRWIQKNNSMPYTVLFENKSTATAPAHIVTVTDTLDLTKYDLKEFGFGSFGFGDTTLVPDGNKLKAFSRDVDLRPDMNLIARVSGRVDTLTGVIKWEFLSLNPSTLLLEEDPFIGFLPPNNANHAGEGFVSFSVGLKQSLGTNAVLKNKASIVFDANLPIITNEYINTLDLDKPQSQVSSLGATSISKFPVTWGGSDVGSGIASYSVYVLQNDTAFWAWKMNTTLETAEFTGEVGSTYKFYSIARDNVSLMEDVPAQYDASTQIVVHVDEFELKKDELKVFPNPATDKLSVSLRNAPAGLYVVELVGVNGQVYYSKIHDDSTISKGIQIGVEGCSAGQYLVRMVYGNKSVTRKVLIK